MNYRQLGRSGIMVSEIGMGCEHLQGKDYEVVKAAIDEAFAQGVNIFDVFMSEPMVRSNIGKAFQGRREKAIIQGHIGSTWQNGQYTHSRNLQECKVAFEDLLSRLETDYIDIGMIHFADTDECFDRIFSEGIMDYVKELKSKGVIKAIGFGTHETKIAKRAVEAGLIDVLMFSINPAFDLMPSDISFGNIMSADEISTSMQNRIDPERTELYQLCEKNNIAITVMKAYMAGRLLNAEQSPFEMALTPAQCIHYALTRPAVSSALIGGITPDEIQKAVAYETASDEEKDFSEVFMKTFTAEGKCVYCNHCLPCPVYIDIAQVNKYLDLAQATDEIPATVIVHYRALSVRAESCVACGICEERCPFGVPVRQRMKEADIVLS